MLNANVYGQYNQFYSSANAVIYETIITGISWYFNDLTTNTISPIPEFQAMNFLGCTGITNLYCFTNQAIYLMSGSQITLYANLPAFLSGSTPTWFTQNGVTAFSNNQGAVQFSDGQFICQIPVT